VITIDKSGANLSAINSLKPENSDVLSSLEIRQNKYLNNIVEQDHRFIKRILSGIEIMNMIRKGQVDGLNQNALLKFKFINELFGTVDQIKNLMEILHFFIIVALEPFQSSQNTSHEV